MKIDDLNASAEAMAGTAETGAGAMTRAVASHDWADTPFGDRRSWPVPLSTMVDFLLASDAPMTLYWGDDWRIVFNDAALPGFGNRVAELGMTGEQAWGDWWPGIRAHFAEVERSGRSLTLLDQGFTEPDGDGVREIYWNLTFWPVADGTGKLAGILCAARDVTSEVFQRRLDRLLVELDGTLAGADTLQGITTVALRLIAQQLDADRVGFAEVDPQTDSFEVREAWAKSDMPDIRGRYPTGAFGDIGATLARGETVVIDNAAHDARTTQPHVLTRNAQMAMMAGMIVPIRDRDKYVGGIFVQNASPRRWTKFEITIAETATQRLWNALQRLRTDFALRASEERYRLIFEQAEDIIFTADIDQRITDANEAGARAIGLTRAALIGRSIAEFVDAAGFRQTTNMLDTKLREGGNTRHELPVTAPDGRQMRWENNSTLIVDPDKRPIGLLSISRDVTERREFEERRELLINELNHRVKNTLALVQAIAHQSFRSEVEGTPPHREFVARIGMLASAHDLLTREHWEGVTLAKLIRAAIAPLDPDRIAISGPPLTLNPKAAVAIAMALHELGTNAMKYGALSVDSGRVGIRWSVEKDRLSLDWEERGGPPVAAPDRQGFGVKMIERALASDLRANVSVDFAGAGVHCRIDAPLEGNIA